MDEERREGGRLVLVATPIGNLGDLSDRARRVLEDADTIYCEDTRRTRILLSAVGIPAGGRLRTLNDHTESEATPEVLARVVAGEDVALVSDAGTPGVSDPGTRVVAAAAAAGLEVTMAPGPSAPVMALVLSGLPTDRCVIEGFVPRRAGDRARRIEEWRRERRTIVALESPVRLATTLEEIARVDPTRRAAVCRELTKVHEEVRRGTAAELAAWAAGGEVRGEIVIVLAGVSAPEASDEMVVTALRERLVRGERVGEAASAVAAELGVSRRRAYEAALELRREG